MPTTPFMSPSPAQTPLTCKKRTGQTVPFDRDKIAVAVLKCFANCPYTVEPEKTAARIAAAVETILRCEKDFAPDVETVQRYVIRQLWAEHLFTQAEHYQNYREERRKAREWRPPVAAAVAARITEDRKHFPTDLQYYQFMSKFSRWSPGNGRRETWQECVDDRVIPWLMARPRAVGKVTPAERQKLRDAMFRLEASPAMRVVQMAGPALDRCNMGAYNCLTSDTAFITANGVKTFDDFADGETTTVLTHTGQWREATVRMYGHKRVNRIRFARGRSTCTVRATTDHRWVMKDGSVTTDLRVGDRIHVPPAPFNSWSFDDAEPDEKLYWAYGFVYGDGSCTKKNGVKTGSMVRLCGDKAQHLDRFTELGFGHSFPPSNDGDPVVYTGNYTKSLPNLDNDEIRKVRAFVAGWLDADGRKDLNWDRNGLNRYKGIQVSGDEGIAFVRAAFPAVGVYISNEQDVTGQTTNYGVRDKTTVRFGLTQEFGKAPNSTFSVMSIEPDGVKQVPVWCLEVEEDHSFVLPSGLVTGNCSYLPISDIRFFPELLYILMQGTGVGFSVESEYVSQLPRIQKQKGGPRRTIVVEDSTEGWCDAYYEFLVALWNGENPFVDVSKIRPENAILKTKGGRASGPGPFLELICFARNIILSKQGKFLDDIDAHDLACMTGKIVQVGGVRRAALISLSDLDSRAMRDAKSGNWYEKNVQRAMSNNSATYSFEDGVPAELFMEEWLALAKSGTGERGIFNRQAAYRYSPKRRNWKHWLPGVNPCAEILIRPYGLCNLSMVIARCDDTEETLMEKVWAATFFGKLQSLATDFKYVRKEWHENAEEEMLLGVDITGHADCPLLRYGAPGRSALLRRLKARVDEVDVKLSERFGVNRSAANTCVKPGGDSALLFDCASGVTARPAAQQIRWVRESKGSPVAKFLIDQGVPHAPAPEAPDRLLVFGFPKQAPAGSMLQTDMTARDQFLNWLEWKENWAEHSVSTTIAVGPAEWPSLGGLVYDHIDKVTGVAFLPRDGGSYAYAPNQPLSEKEYADFVANFPPVDWTRLPEYETNDQTTSRITFACVGGACDS